MHAASRVEPLPVRGALVLFVVALVLRVVAIFVLDSSSDVSKGTWEWGFEAGSIAQSVHEGHGYANPWMRDVPPWNEPSGPTAWLTPAYPGMIAALFNVFGELSPSLATALFLVQALLAAATCVILWALGNAVGEPRAGKLGGWILAFYPAAIWNAAHTVWDTTLTAFGLVAFAWAIFLFRRSGPRGWLAIGVGFGALLLVNPAPLALTPVLAWILWRERPNLGGLIVRGLAFVFAAFLVLWPWLARNERAVGAFALRTNFGVEMHVGNNDEGNGRFQVAHHPSNSAEEFRRYRAMGEVAYARWALDEAKRWIADNPGRFALLTLRRVKIFWIGDDPFSDPRREDGKRPSEDWASWIKWLLHLSSGVLGLAGAIVLARRGPDGKALMAILFLFPLAYYLTHFMERYRYPIEPLIVLCAAVAVLAWLDRRRELART